MSSPFWRHLDQLVSEHTLVLDRPQGSLHPRYADSTYPLDYGYLEGTSSGDGDGIDVWRGSEERAFVTAIICSLDGVKADAEIKLLVGCTADEIDMIEAFHNHGEQAALAIRRDSD